LDYFQIIIKIFLRYIHFFAAAQAIIYSQKARNKIIKYISLNDFDKGQIDPAYIGKLDKKFTYKYPLIVQLFPNTENKNVWFNNVFLTYIIDLKIALLQVDTHPDGWYLLYFGYRNYKMILLIIFLIIIGSIYNIIKFFR
jgi:hypothetical protein